MIALVVWWTMGAFLALFQLWVMTRAWWVLPLAAIGTILACRGLLSWRRAYLRRERWALRTFVLYCAMHGVPLLLQLATVVPARIGNVAFAAIGLGMYLLSTVRRPAWFRTWIL